MRLRSSTRKQREGSRRRKSKKWSAGARSDRDSSIPNEYTLEEVSRHDKADDLWVVVDGVVYDITKFLEKHPGGTAPLRYGGSRDASDVFPKIHRRGTLERVGKRYAIGRVRSDDAKRKEEGDYVRGSATKASYYDIDKDEEGYDERQPGEPGREFGDRMAQMGETSNIPTVILVMYGLIGGYSWLARAATGCSIWTIPAYYALGMVAFYIWHAMAHSEWSGEMHEIHMEHHLERFPPTDFYGSAALYAEMYPDGKPTIWDLMDLRKTTNIADGTAASKEGIGLGDGRKKHTPLAHEGPLFVFMVLIVVGGYFLRGTSTGALAFVLVGYLIMGCVGNALHMSFHVRGFHLEEYAWYRELRALHYIHHLGDMKSNLAMLNLGMDGLFRSLSILDPADPKHIAPGLARSDSLQTLISQAKDAALPSGIGRDALLGATQHAGASALLLGLDLPVNLNDAAMSKHRSAVSRGYPTVLLRIAIVLLLLRIWFSSEARVEAYFAASTSANSDLPASSFASDPGHTLTASLGAWISEHELGPSLCAVSAAISEVSVLAIVAVAILGPTFRPMLSLGANFILRALLGLLGTPQLVPLAARSAWALPTGWPTIFVQSEPQVSNQFYSARVALAVVAANELVPALFAALGGRSAGRSSVWWWAEFIVGTLLVAFQVCLSLALRASWSFDIIISVVLARRFRDFATRLARYTDAFLP